MDSRTINISYNNSVTGCVKCIGNNNCDDFQNRREIITPFSLNIGTLYLVFLHINL